MYLRNGWVWDLGTSYLWGCKSVSQGGKSGVEERETQYVYMQEQNTKALKGKEKLCFWPQNYEMPFNVLPGIKSYGSCCIQGCCWVCPAWVCAALCQQHLERVCEIQRAQMKFSKGVCQKSSNQDSPICLAFYLQSIFSAPLCLK